MRVYIVLLILFLSTTADSRYTGLRVPFYIKDAAHYFTIDPILMYAICSVESNCNSRVRNVNDGTEAQRFVGIISGSYALFQLKLATVRSLGFKGTEKDLLKPEINSYYAAKLLKHLYIRYGNNTLKVLSAYNAGKYTTTNSPYVTKVVKNYARIRIDRRL
jgi:soluble lytic murein transglycosylase-like protein